MSKTWPAIIRTSASAIRAFSLLPLAFLLPNDEFSYIAVTNATIMLFIFIGGLEYQTLFYRHIGTAWEENSSAAYLSLIIFSGLISGLVEVIITASSENGCQLAILIGFTVFAEVITNAIYRMWLGQGHVERSAILLGVKNALWPLPVLCLIALNWWAHDPVVLYYGSWAGTLLVLLFCLCAHFALKLNSVADFRPLRLVNNSLSRLKTSRDVLTSWSIIFIAGCLGRAVTAGERTVMEALTSTEGFAGWIFLVTIGSGVLLLVDSWIVAPSVNKIITAHSKRRMAAHIFRTSLLVGGGLVLALSLVGIGLIHLIPISHFLLNTTLIFVAALLTFTALANNVVTVLLGLLGAFRANLAGNMAAFALLTTMWCIAVPVMDPEVIGGLMIIPSAAAVLMKVGMLFAFWKKRG